jgi:hypothetical protein
MSPQGPQSSQVLEFCVCVTVSFMLWTSGDAPGRLFSILMVNDIDALLLHFATVVSGRSLASWLEKNI